MARSKSIFASRAAAASLSLLWNVVNSIFGALPGARSSNAIFFGSVGGQREFVDLADKLVPFKISNALVATHAEPVWNLTVGQKLASVR